MDMKWILLFIKRIRDRDRAEKRRRRRKTRKKNLSSILILFVRVSQGKNKYTIIEVSFLVEHQYIEYVI